MFQHVCNVVLVGSDAGRLERLRRETPNISLSDLAKAASLRDEETKSLESALTSGSLGASLWINSGSVSEFHVTETVNGRSYSTSFTR